MPTPAHIATALKRLRARYPSSGALEIGTPYHMVSLVIMSARTRDDQVLKLAPRFFRAFPTVHDLARADVATVAATINTIGMYKQKAKNLCAMAQRLVNDFGGKVPSTMDELVSLPGVGRKTASVILVAAFDVPAIAVDTHVHRVTNRLGWVKTKTPAETERELRRRVAEKDWPTINKVFVPFGRAICIPGSPRCSLCPLVDVCQFKKKNLDAPRNVEAITAAIARQEAALARLKANAVQ